MASQKCRFPQVEAFVHTISARLNMRIDDAAAVNDTALHVAAYTYDHESLLALLIKDGTGSHVDTADSAGRTALHYAADVQDQVSKGVFPMFVPSLSW
jgi:ankyrin repeat protein